jgi:putative endonuclease
VGYSDKPERRLSEHNHNEKLTYTSKHRPWISKKIIELGNHRGFAMKIEKAIKKSKSRIIIEKIINDINSIDALAQMVRVPMHRDRSLKQKASQKCEAFLVLWVFSYIIKLFQTFLGGTLMEKTGSGFAEVPFDFQKSKPSTWLPPFQSLLQSCLVS